MKVVSVLLAIILSAVSLRAFQIPENAKVESVEIRGNRRIPIDTIKYHIQTKPGDVLRMDVIQRDVKQLYAQKFFDDIRVDAEDGKSGGLVVVFVVKERPLVRG